MFYTFVSRYLLIACIVVDITKGVVDNATCKEIYGHANIGLLKNKYCGVYNTAIEPRTTTHLVSHSMRPVNPREGTPSPKFPWSGYYPDGNELARILGGKTAGEREFPWVVQLVWRNYMSLRVPRCAGTLISKRYVLTAATCVTIEKEGSEEIGGNVFTKRLASNLVIRMKTTKRVNDPCPTTSNPGCEDFDAEEIIIRNIQTYEPLFSGRKYYLNDIALVRVVRDVEFVDGRLFPICLPKCLMLDDMMHEKWGIVAGYGAVLRNPRIRPSEVYPHNMIKMFAKIKDTHECINSTFLQQKMICIENNVEHSTACPGDAGDPLVMLMFEYRLNGMFKSHINYYHQVGILSGMGGACQTDDLPRNQNTIFTRVGYFVSWILDNMRP